MTPPPEHTTKNWLEWTVFGISVALVSTILILLANAAVRTKVGPARLRAETGPAVAENGWLRIPVTITNDGENVASNVDVQVRIGSWEQQREAGFSIDFVPRGATRKGAVSFKGAQMPTDFECEVLGYEEP
jgi:uncharacterized protein (TIGR02588 family)